MQDQDNLSEYEIEDQKIIENIELNIYEALIPVIILMGLLAYNIFYADGVWLGDYSNQIILLMGGAEQHDDVLDLDEIPDVEPMERSSDGDSSYEGLFD